MNIYTLAGSQTNIQYIHIAKKKLCKLVASLCEWFARPMNYSELLGEQLHVQVVLSKQSSK